MQWFVPWHVCLLCMLQCEHWYKALSVCLNCMCNDSGIFTCVQWFGYLHVCHCHCLQSAKCAMIWKLSWKPTLDAILKNGHVYLQIMQWFLYCMWAYKVCNGFRHRHVFLQCMHWCNDSAIVPCACNVINDLAAVLSFVSTLEFGIMQ